jgi:Uma2 family endonuclease
VTASALAKSFPVFDFETYLELELRAPNKNEFYHGHIYAMAGGTNRHHLLCTASLFELSKLLSKRNCFVLPGEAKVETPNTAAVFYPDVSVHCDQKLPLESLTTKSPILVVEVLSPSTRKYDLTTKRKEYFRIPSLRHYLVLDSEAESAILYTRDDNQTWPKDPLTFTDPKASIPLTALKITLKLKDLYRQTGLL